MICLFYGTIFLPLVFSSIQNIHFAKGKYQNQLDKLNKYEIVIPQRLEGRERRSINTLDKDKHIKDTAFSLTAFGHDYELLVKLNEDLLPINSIEKYYLQDGTPIIRRHNQLEHCYYQGGVRNIPNSLVVLHTCKGLDGLVTLPGQETFIIEPLKGSNDEHVIYRMEDLKDVEKDNQNGKNSKCKVVNKESLSPSSDSYDGQIKMDSRKKRDTPNLSTTKYIELYLVNDNDEYQYNSKSVDKTITRSLQAANLANAVFRPLNIIIAVVGIEVWSDYNQIYLTIDAEDDLFSFARWRERRLLPQSPNDLALFISGNIYPKVDGLAVRGAICSSKVGVALATDYLTIPKFAHIVAHEIGHSLGMLHDDDIYQNDSKILCGCDEPVPRTHCIMSALTDYHTYSPPTMWSQCSVNSTVEAHRSGIYACLYNRPDMVYGGPICGNSILEEGEECEIPFGKDTNKCCDLSTCKRKPSSECATGKCCDDDCQFKPSGTLCRKNTSECDLPEFCTGLSPSCPGDVYLQNGVACTQPAPSVCYEGACHTRDQQCKEIFGPDSKESHEECYQSLNLVGNKTGNCGYERPNIDEYLFSNCLKGDVMCGTLQCSEGSSKKPTESSEVSNTSLLIDGTFQICKSAMIDLGKDVRDPGWVKSGTICGIGMVCKDFECQSLEILGVRPCQQNCTFHGVCNSKNNCHCDKGWAPPLCDVKGVGGSIDSGPIAPPSPDLPEQSTLFVALVILLLIPTMLIASYIIYIRRTRISNFISHRMQRPRGTPQVL